MMYSGSDAQLNMLSNESGHESMNKVKRLQVIDNEMKMWNDNTNSETSNDRAYEVKIMKIMRNMEMKWK